MKKKRVIERIVAVLLAVVLVATSYTGSSTTLHAASVEEGTSDAVADQSVLEANEVDQLIENNETSLSIENNETSQPIDIIEADQLTELNADVPTEQSEEEQQTDETTQPDVQMENGESKKESAEEVLITFVAGKGGSVSAGEQRLNAEASVQPVKATAEDGYKFVNWTNSANKIVSDQAEFTAEKLSETYTANFEVADSAFTFEQAIGGVTVKINAAKGVFPEGVTVRVVAVPQDKIEDLLSEQMRKEGKDIVDAVGFDITFYNKEGSEIQPNGDVDIKFENVNLSDNADDATVYHVDEKGSEPIVEVMDADFNPTDTEVSIETDSFSSFILVNGAIKPYTGYADEKGGYSFPLYVLEDGKAIVAYCFNAPKNWPMYQQNSYAKILNADAEDMRKYSGLRSMQVRENVLRVIWNGYPYSNVIQNKYGLSDMQYRAVTQAAVWNVTDGMTIDSSIPDLQSYGVPFRWQKQRWVQTGFFSWQGYYEDTNLTKAYNELLASRNNPSENFQLDLYVHAANINYNNGTVQNLLSTRLQKVDEKKINISVTKKWEGVSNPPTSVDIELYANEELYSAATIRASEGWKYTFENLPEKAGSKEIVYSIKEVIPAGATYVGEVTGNKTSGFIITNRQTKVYSVDFKKVAEDGTPLAGARFEMYKESELVDAWNTPDTNTAITVPASTKKIEPNVTYTVKEVTIPAGYQKIKDFEFQLGEDGFVKANTLKYTDGTAAADLLTLTSEGSISLITVKNREEDKTVRISKVNLGGTEIAGAEIAIYKGEKAEGTPVQKWLSVAGQTKEIKLAPGTYTFHEITVPAGYQKVTDITFRVAANGNVTVTNQNDNTVSASGNKLTVTDKYTPVSTTIEATKTLTGKELKDSDFTFTLKGTSANAQGTAQTKNNKGTKVTFDELTYDATGDYVYEVKETAGNAGGVTYDTSAYTVTVKVTEGRDGLVLAKEITKNGQSAREISFVNSYAPAAASLNLTATKVLEGKALENEMFTFTLEGDQVKQTKKNDAQGNVTFDTLNYTEAGTYTYTVKETAESLGGISYDGSVYTVTVKVTDDGNGNLKAATPEITVTKEGTSQTAGEITFTNTYSTEDVKVNLQAKKELTVPRGSQRELQDGEFSFTLAEADENYEEVRDIETKACDKAGNIGFGEIVYTQAGNHYYTIKEEQGNAAGVSYTDKVVKVKVNVTDNGDGTLSAVTTYDDAADVPTFTNTYTPGSAILSLGATKEMIGRDLRAGEFEFTLSENGSVLQTKTNTADGRITFDEITYEEAGEYTYTIAEVDKGTSGVCYDRSVFEIIVTVTDDGSGQLTAAADTAKNGASVTGADFVNNAISFIVNKTDITGSEEVEGAEISIFEVDANGVRVEAPVDKWTSKKGEVHDFGPILKPNRKYVLSETVTPEGYKAIADTVFTVDENGKVTSELPKVSVVTATGERVEQNLVRNELSEQAVSFSKQNMTGDELTGATIEVRKAGETRAVETWKSDGSVHEFKLLPGEYEFVETAAPEGYKLATNIRFTVDKDGVLQVTSADTTVLKTDPTNDKQVIVMVDELKDRPNEDRGGKEYPVKFSKQNLLGEELKGATIVLRNADSGTQIETWKSDGTVKEFTVKPGNYQFVETAAPEGYKLATEINFTVTEDGKLNVTSSNVQVLNEGRTGEEIIVMIDEFASDTPTTPQGGEEKPKDNVVEPRGNTETPKTTKTSKSPITGDETTALLWLLLMGMGVAGIAGTIYNRKKEEN